MSGRGGVRTGRSNRGRKLPGWLERSRARWPGSWGENLVPTCRYPTWRSPVPPLLTGVVIVWDVIFARAGGPVVVLDGLTLTRHRWGYNDVIVLWGPMAGFPERTLIGTLAGTLRKVGVDERCLTLAFWMGTVRVRWEELQVSVRGFRPRGEFVAIRIGWSAVRGIAGLWPERVLIMDGVALRRVLSHPGAARTRLGVPYWLDLGLTPP